MFILKGYLSSMPETTPNNQISFTCETCNKVFDKLKNLKRHEKLHSKVKPFVCECGKSYSRSDHLNRHKISHSENTKPFQCSLCVSRFSNRSHLNRHMKLHLEEKNEERSKGKYFCSICNISFNHKTKYKKHQSKEHLQLEKTIECYYPYCCSKFKSEKHLDDHIDEYHNMLKNFSKVFNTDQLFLSDNIFMNEANKALYMCIKCEKAFTTEYNLKYHCRTCSSSTSKSLNTVTTLNSMNIDDENEIQIDNI